MAKVKHMAVGAPKRGQDGGRASARRLGASQQGHGVEVSLQSNAITDPVARRADIQRPIDADRVTTARRDRLEPGASTLGEQDVRYAFAMMLALEFCEDALHIG